MSQELIEDMLREIFDSDLNWEINEEFECSDGDKEEFYTECAQKNL